MPGSQPIRFGMKTLLGVMTGSAILFGAIAIWGGTAIVVAIFLVVGGIVYVRADAKLPALAIYLCVATVAALLIVPSWQRPRINTRIGQCSNNLKQLAMSLCLYHDVYGRFPPAYIPDKNGRPMHSWRVLILPFLERSDIYDAYDFSEPWNGPNNSKLADAIPDVFHCPSDVNFRSGKHTNYVAVVGPGTVWPGEKTVSIGDIKDGTSNTLLLVEVADSDIHWMEPRDLHVSQMAPTINAKKGQGISSKHPGNVNAAFADASVRHLYKNKSREDVRALLTIDGGEEIDLTDW